MLLLIFLAVFTAGGAALLLAELLKTGFAYLERVSRCCAVWRTEDSPLLDLRLP